MYSPFSVYSPIPWAIVFNVVEVVLMMLLDAALLELFTRPLKASLCLLLFVANLLYILYIIIIHMQLFFVKCRKPGKPRVYPITFSDLLNIMIASPFIWTWLFLALYYFSADFYSPGFDALDMPGTFYLVYLKMWAYGVLALNGGSSAVFPLRLLSELAEAFAVLYWQLVTMIVLGSLLSYLLDVLS